MCSCLDSSGVTVASKKNMVSISGDVAVYVCNPNRQSLTCSSSYVNSAIGFIEDQCPVNRAGQCGDDHLTLENPANQNPSTRLLLVQRQRFDQTEIRLYPQWRSSLSVLSMDVLQRCKTRGNKKSRDSTTSEIISSFVTSIASHLQFYYDPRVSESKYAFGR